MICQFCGRDEVLRMGACFDCATAGEHRLAKRTVRQHIGKALRHIRQGWWLEAKIDCKLAYERFTRTGDYADGGYFDKEGIDWR